MVNVQKRKGAVRGTYTDIYWENIENIFEYPNNPKEHPKEQVDKIANSIQKFGFDQPIVVDGDGTIIKGHGRRLASRLLGLKQVPVIKRTDMTAAEVRASRIADNQTAESYWDMSNLIYELETLYEMNEEILEDTGYSKKEIDTLLPGLLSDEMTYKTSSIEGIIPLDLTLTAPDKLVGRKFNIEETLLNWVLSHKKIIVLFNGNRTDLSAICWAINNGIPPERITVLGWNFGQRMWHDYHEYMAYISETLGVIIYEGGSNKREDFQSRIASKGFPEEEKLWCCNSYKRKALLDEVGTENGDSVLLLGVTKNEDGEQVYRTTGEFIDSSIHYAAPFAVETDQAITNEIEKAGIKLHPIYQNLQQLLCPGCSGYRSPDFVFLKNYDLDLWIRWMVTVGRAQYCKEYVESGQFNSRLLQMIGDGIDPREFGPYRDYAQELVDVPQPQRETIREGDNYGYDAEVDAKLPSSGRIDIPRENWFQHEEYSRSYIQLEEECKIAKEDIEAVGQEEHMRKVMEKAKEAAAEAILVEGAAVMLEGEENE